MTIRMLVLVLLVGDLWRGPDDDRLGHVMAFELIVDLLSVWPDVLPLLLVPLLPVLLQVPGGAAQVLASPAIWVARSMQRSLAPSARHGAEEASRRPARFRS